MPAEAMDEYSPAMVADRYPHSIFDKHVMHLAPGLSDRTVLNTLEIPALAQALEGLKFEYLLFMLLHSSIEALYDLEM